MTELETLLLGALKQCDEAMIYMSEYDIPIMLPTLVKQAIDAAEAAQQVGDIDVVELTNKAYMDGVNDGIEAEREACARVCDPQPGIKYSPNSHSARQQCAAAIRARSNKH